MYNHFHIILDLLMESNFREKVYYYWIKTADKSQLEMFITIPDGQKKAEIMLKKKHDPDFCEKYKPEDIDQLCRNNSINILDIIYQMEESVATKYVYLRIMAEKIENIWGKEYCEDIMENQREFFKALVQGISEVQKESQKSKLVLIKDANNE